MASATGIPDQSFANEQEPLLGRPGDASQGNEPIYRNLVIGTNPCEHPLAEQQTDKQPGTGVVAQAGVWILAAVVWAAVFSHDLILFSAHPVCISITGVVTSLRSVP
jgi:hypothetical protein